MGSHMTVINEQAKRLSEAYDKFMNIHLEYCKISTQDDKAYFEDVTHEYEDVYKQFITCKSVSDRIEEDRKAAPLRKSVSLDCTRLTIVLDSIRDLLDGDSDDVNELSVYKEEIDPLISVLNGNLADLRCHAQAENEEARIDALIVRSDSIKRRN